MTFIFAVTDVMLADIASGPECGTLMVMLLLFALTIVITYLFSVKCPRGWTSVKAFTRMLVSRWIVLGCWAGLVVICLFVLEVMLDGWVSCLATQSI